MNQPIYKIHGSERRELKKELAKLKSHMKNFWYYHQLDKDMTSFYGGSEKYPMSDVEANEKFNQANLKVKNLEEKLNIKL
jgi:hypothetical protein